MHSDLAALRGLFADAPRPVATAVSKAAPRSAGRGGPGRAGLGLAKAGHVWTGFPGPRFIGAGRRAPSGPKEGALVSGSG